MLTPPHRMNHQETLLFERVKTILLQRYDDTDSITECATEWVSKGHKIPSGCVKYYEAYFLK